MNPVEDTEVMVGGEKVVTRWWIDAARDRDVYELRVVRYHAPVQNGEDGDRWANWSEYLDAECLWHVADDGTIIPPTMVLSGQLVNVLSSLDGLLDRGSISDALYDFCARIIMSAVARKADDETTGSRS